VLIIACAFISHRLSILRISSVFQCLFTLWVSDDQVQWWHGRRAQFPQLYRLVRDIFSIPGNYLYLSTSLLIIKLIYHLSLGSAVAVERIFSGGRDTISLRRASLKPETIQILMLVKRKLIIAREKIAAKLRQPSKLPV
jgi:hypothetical protein